MRVVSSPRRRSHGFTLVEIVVVVSVVAIAAAIAVSGLTAALDTSRREARLRAVFQDLVHRRALHLGRSSPEDACMRVCQIGAKSLQFEERSKCDDPASLQPNPQKSAYDVVSLQLSSNGGVFCIDNLARSVDCATLAPKDVVLAIDADRSAGVDGSITWSRGGRLDSTFGSMDANAQPHLSDVGAAATPNPTTQGSYAGASTNPTGLLE